MVMLVPLMPLAVGAIFAGIVFYPRLRRRTSMAAFWGQSLFVLPRSRYHRGRRITCRNGSSICAAGPRLGGIALAYRHVYLQCPACRRASPMPSRPIYLFLLNKWYFDELYDFLFVRPGQAAGPSACGRAATAPSSTGWAPTASPRSTRSLAQRAGRLQTGYVYHYAFAMLIGVVLLISWYLYWPAR